MCAAVSLPRPFFLLFVLLSLFELPQHKKLDILFYRGQTSDFPWAKQPIQGSALAGITSVSARKSWPQLNFCATLLINNQFQHCRIYHLSMHHRPGSASGVRLLDMWIHSFYFPPSTSLYFFSIYFPTSKGENFPFGSQSFLRLHQMFLCPHSSHLYLSFLGFNVLNINCALSFSVLTLRQGSHAVMASVPCS